MAWISHYRHYTIGLSSSSQHLFFISTSCTAAPYRARRKGGLSKSLKCEFGKESDELFNGKRSIITIGKSRQKVFWFTSKTDPCLSCKDGMSQAEAGSYCSKERRPLVIRLLIWRSACLGGVSLEKRITISDLWRTQQEGLWNYQSCFNMESGRLGRAKAAKNCPFFSGRRDFHA